MTALPRERVREAVSPDGSGTFTSSTQWANESSHHDEWNDDTGGPHGYNIDFSSSGKGSSGYAVRWFADGTTLLVRLNSDAASESEEWDEIWGDFPGTSQDFYVYRHGTAESTSSSFLEGTAVTYASAGEWAQDWTWRQGSRSGSGAVSGDDEETFTSPIDLHGAADDIVGSTGWEFESLVLLAAESELQALLADTFGLDAFTSISIPDINWDGDVIISSGNWATDFLANQIRNAVGDENLIAIGDYVEGTFTAIVDQMGSLYDWAANLSVDDLLAAGSDIVSSPQKLLDAVQVGLDIVGLIPVLGELADGTNALISLARGDFVAAGLSAVSMIPVWGDAVGKGGKLTRAVVKYGDEVADVSQSAIRAGRRVASSFDEFRIGRNFTSAEEAQKAWEMYRRAARAPKGLVIGHGDAPLKHAYGGWQALRLGAQGPRKWTLEINRAWIDGAVDAGKPIRLVTPFNDVIRGSVTWKEIQQVIFRGGQLIAG